MEKVRIQDDLYHHVNGDWLEQAVIPDDKPLTGGFADLDEGVTKTLIQDFISMSEADSYPNIYLKRACAIFKKVRDTKTRNKAGINPIKKDLKKILALKSIRSFNNNLKAFIDEGYPMPFSFCTDVDMMDTKHHCIMLFGPSTILPDTNYYKEGMEAQKEQLFALWSNMVNTLLGYTKLTEEEKALFIADAIKFDSIVATLVKSQEEWSNYTKMYNPMKLSRVNSLLKPIKFKKLLLEILGQEPENIIVADPKFLKGFKSLFNEETFEAYKHWAYINLIIGACPYLSEKLREQGSIYKRALTGTAAITAVDKHAYKMASSYFSEPVGVYYGDKYFGQEAKKDVTEMVVEIIDTYKTRIANNDFLSEPTKQKAILKLSTIAVKMGYPDQINPEYDELVFDEEASLYEISKQINKIRNEIELKKFNQEVDRSRWVMAAHIVNACYNPTSNDITFPAAILQAPFYSINQTRSQNLGGIGAVIGHEISHAFDNNGAKCDENGNLKNWWTKEDNQKFNQKTKAMIKQFDGIMLPAGRVNGKFTVSENIADNGGMSVTLDIMSRMDQKSYEEYFINWAKVWCSKAKPEYEALLLQIDVHGPKVLRSNMQVQNFAEWYETFNVKKTDKMYLPLNKRIRIW